MNAHRLRAVGAMVVLVLALAGCGDDDDGAAPQTSDTTTTSPTTTEPTAEERVVRAYFLFEEKVGPVSRTATGSEVAAAAMEALLAGPEATEAEVGFSSAIPTGTELLGVSLSDGVATVDLSAEFTSGGGSLSMTSRVAQVVYTLTQFPTVDAVSFAIEGEPVDSLGGEGVMVDDPQTRADWEQLSPAILIESPLPFEDVTSPLRITGTANTFEATFVLTVVDGEGLIVYEEPVTATSGSGERGTFDVTASFEVPRAGSGAVIAFEESAEDGRQVHVVEVPVGISG